MIKKIPLPQVHLAISSTMEDFCGLNLMYPNDNGSIPWLAPLRLYEGRVSNSSVKYDN